jgi:hypothetical protein
VKKNTKRSAVIATPLTPGTLGKFYCGGHFENMVMNILVSTGHAVE